MKINLTSNLDLTNNVHTQGKNLGLYGSISSNYNIVRIGGYILQPKPNSNTKKRIQSTDNTDIRYHNTKEVNINKSNLNNDLLFRPLEPGDYILQIYAVDSSGKTQTLNKNFTVVKSSNSSLVTGTVVNLSDLGWDNLSIRTGPSTSYKIIGCMTSGEQCTINLNKSINNWYYVEYNDIKGYASKTGISR